MAPQKNPYPSAMAPAQPPPQAPPQMQQLAPGWMAAQTPEGQTYYCNPQTGQTSWTPPNAGGGAPGGYPQNYY